MSESVIRLYDGITNIDEDIIEEAEEYVPNVITVNWKRWGALAASLVIIGAGAFGLFRSGLLKPAAGEEVYSTDSTAGQGEEYAAAAMPAEVPAEEPAYEWAEEPMEMPAEEPAYEAEPAEDNMGETKDSVSEEAERNVYINNNTDILYYPASYSSVLDVYDMPINRDDPEFIRYQNGEFTKADLGDEMGEVTGVDNLSMLMGCKVYHFAKMPDFDAVCLVEYPSAYFGEGKYVLYKAEESYELYPEGMSFSEVMDKYGLPDSVIIGKVSSLTRRTRQLDKDQIKAVFDVLKTKTVCDFEEYERQRDQAGEPDEEALKRSSSMEFVTDKGYDIYIGYLAETGFISSTRGYFKLTESDAAALEKILGLS